MSSMRSNQSFLLLCPISTAAVMKLHAAAAASICKSAMGRYSSQPTTAAGHPRTTHKKRSTSLHDIEPKLLKRVVVSGGILLWRRGAVALDGGPDSQHCHNCKLRRIVAVAIPDKRRCKSCQSIPQWLTAQSIHATSSNNCKLCVR